MKIRHKKLQQWVDAGLIDTGQADAIHAYEQERKSGRFGRGLNGIGVFAILIGVLSLIAANWHGIPSMTKVAGHVLVNLLAACLALWAMRRGRDLLREGAVLAFFGLTLTLIVLIGQIYQLEGSASGAFILWMVLATPFLFLAGNGYMTAVPWMAALLTTVALTLLEKLDPLPQHYRHLFGIGTAALLPLALMADGSIGAFRRLRPALCDVAVRAGIALSALCASCSLLFWQFRDDFDRVESFPVLQSWVIFAAGGAGLFAHAVLHKFYAGDMRLKYGALFAAAGLAALMLPMVLPLGEGAAVLAPLLFIGYWMFLGWLAQGLGQMRFVSLAITIIALRIFGIYVELFGTLASTGFGLIVSGALLLALMAGVRKLNTRLTRKAVPHA